jgi:prepilin-type processing-associated H-X9-DG protein
MLLPALGKARGKAKQIDCMSRYKQIGSALGMYVNDYSGYLPGPTPRLPYMFSKAGSDGSFSRNLNEYISKDDSWWLCPSNGEEVYGVDGRLFVLNNKGSTNPEYFFGYPDYGSGLKLPKKMSQVLSGKADGCYLLKELCAFTYWAPYDVIAPPHSKGYNELYFDGHVELKKDIAVGE